MIGYNESNFIGCDAGVTCFKAATASTGYALSDTNSMESSAIMTWIYRSANDDTNAVSEDVIYHTSTSPGLYSYDFKFLLKSDMTLEASYAKSYTNSSATGSDEINISLSNSTNVLSLGAWHHVELTSNVVKGLTIFADGQSLGNLGAQIWKALDPAYMNEGNMYLSKIIMNSASPASGESYDDFRIYQGIVQNLHIKAIYECGRKQLCAGRAYAKPQSRRTYCVIVTLAASSTQEQTCATGLYYNGLAIDLTISASTKGALFSFRDSAHYESGFEVLRREVGDGGESIYTTYQAVILIDSDLSGCASDFNSLTFFDGDVMKSPGSVWEYAIRTKYPSSTSDELDIVSDAVTYTTPGYGIVEGTILAGDTEVAVPNVRVCTRLVSSTTASSTVIGTLADSSTTLSQYRYVEHSNSTKQSSAYVATDSYQSTLIGVEEAEWIKIDLNPVYIYFISVRLCRWFNSHDNVSDHTRSRL